MIVTYLTFIRNFSTNAISSIFSSDLKREVFVGRWSVPNTNTNVVINRIIDRNNEDHCGVCINSNEDIQNIVKNKENITNDDEYYTPFFM